MIKVYKSIMFLSENQGEILSCDTIEYKGKFWLVGQWLDSPEQGLSIPTKLICLENFAHQKTIGGEHGDFVINDQVPKELFDDPIPTKLKEKYGVVERPEIKIEGPGGIH